MPNVILNCKYCHNRFPYFYEDGFETLITCKNCGKISPWDTYTVILHCPHCHTNLEERVQDCTADLLCPTCNSQVPIFASTSLENLHTPESITISVSRHTRMFQDGEFIDKYRVIRMIGHGAMAEVYLAEHAMLHQQYAVKVMKPTLAESSNTVYGKRFLREAKISMAIQHPNIVSVVDAGNDPKTGLLFIVMEYIDGGTLAQEVEREILSPEQLLFVAHEMAQALIVLRKANVVHRDIKPSNIMRSHDGSLKLTDLGIAKKGINNEQAEGETSITMTDIAIGSPAYASPEQCADGHRVDNRSDIYNLGATLYHLATGHVPFKGASAVETFMMVINNKPVPIKKYRSDLPNSLCKLIYKMMAKKASKRPQTPEKLLEMINRITPQYKNSKFNRLLPNILTGSQTSPDGSSKAKTRLYIVLIALLAVIAVIIMIIAFSH